MTNILKGVPASASGLREEVVTNWRDLKTEADSLIQLKWSVSGISIAAIRPKSKCFGLNFREIFGQRLTKGSHINMDLVLLYTHFFVNFYTHCCPFSVCALSSPCKEKMPYYRRFKDED